MRLLANIFSFIVLLLLTSTLRTYANNGGNYLCDYLLTEISGIKTAAVAREDAGKTFFGKIKNFLGTDPELKKNLDYLRQPLNPLPDTSEKDYGIADVSVRYHQGEPLEAISFAREENRIGTNLRIGAISHENARNALAELNSRYKNNKYLKPNAGEGEISFIHGVRTYGGSDFQPEDPAGVQAYRNRLAAGMDAIRRKAEARGIDFEIIFPRNTSHLTYQKPASTNYDLRGMDPAARTTVQAKFSGPEGLALFEEFLRLVEAQNLPQPPPAVRYSKDPVSFESMQRSSGTQ